MASSTLNTLNVLTIDDLVLERTEDGYKPRDLGNDFVFLRSDTNTTLVEGEVPNNERIEAAYQTIKKLKKANAKIIIGAHNGRPGELSDISLWGLWNVMPPKIRGSMYCPGNTYNKEKNDLNQETKEIISRIEPGDAILLENLRFLKDENTNLPKEEHAKKPLITTLKQLGVRYYVNDAFSASHRSHMSIVGFYELPCIAGLTMEKELINSEKVIQYFRSEGKKVFILGGSKINEYLDFMVMCLKNQYVDKIAAVGLLGNLGLFVQGNDLGKPSRDLLERKNLWKEADRIKDILGEYGGKIVLPADLAYRVNGERREYKVGEIPEEVKKQSAALDIGKETYSVILPEILKDAVFCLHKGPAGIEDKNFNDGSRHVVTYMAEADKMYTMLCGGDTSTQLVLFGIKNKRFDHISLGGGASTKYIESKLSGEDKEDSKKLPGIAVLEESWKKNQSMLLRYRNS